MSEREFDLYLELLAKFLRLRPGQTAEIADELRDHLEARLEEFSRAGLSRADAVRRALDEFGDVASLADHFSQLARERKQRFIMRSTFAAVSVASVVLMFGSALWPRQAGLQLGPTPSVALAAPNEAADVDPDERVNQILDTKKVDLLFEGESLAEVIDSFSKQLAVDIVATKDIQDGLLDHHVTLKVHYTVLTGRAALQLVLEQYQLSFVIRDGMIQLRLPDQMLAIEMLNVRSLLAAGGDDADAKLIETVQRMVSPNAWQETGGYGTLSVFRGLLIVRNTPEIIGEVHRFLSSLEERVDSIEK